MFPRFLFSISVPFWPNIWLWCRHLLIQRKSESPKEKLDLKVLFCKKREAFVKFSNLHLSFQDSNSFLNFSAQFFRLSYFPLRNLHQKLAKNKNAPYHFVIIFYFILYIEVCCTLQQIGAKKSNFTVVFFFALKCSGTHSYHFQSNMSPMPNALF